MEALTARAAVFGDAFGVPFRRVAPAILGATAWVSLSPYFVWGSVDALFYCGIVAVVVAGLLLVTGARPRTEWAEISGIALVTLFLIYITLEPKLNGGHTRWVFVLPTLGALALFSDSERRRCIAAFTTIFAASLVPAILVSLWIALGLPMTFQEIPHPNAVMAAAGVKVLVSPLAVFIESNSIVLPWGGVLVRLCGVYDEPGTAGTIAALLLAAFRYRSGWYSDWRLLILWIGGLLTFSLSFIALCFAGCVALGIATRRPGLLVAVVPLAVAGAMALGVVRTSALPVKTVVAEGQQSRMLQPSETLRQTTVIDNRDLPSMRALEQDYLHSGFRTLVFGIASDASVAKGGSSEVWTRVLVDHGIFGFVLLFGGIGLLGVAAWRRGGAALAGLVFLGIFALSIYQRPVVWLPYALTILMCGPFAVADPAVSPEPIRP